jgi:penicillin-binding protein 1A
MSVRTALAKSKNMVSIQILQGWWAPSSAQQWVTRFGFEADKHPPYLTMALGAGTVTRCRWPPAMACLPTAVTTSRPR